VVDLGKRTGTDFRELQIKVRFRRVADHDKKTGMDLGE
jgi:hypothetical protein